MLCLGLHAFCFKPSVYMPTLIDRLNTLSNAEAELKSLNANPYYFMMLYHLWKSLKWDCKYIYAALKELVMCLWYVNANIGKYN